MRLHQNIQHVEKKGAEGPIFTGYSRLTLATQTTLNNYFWQIPRIIYNKLNLVYRFLTIR